jgi:steroid delta-isomerase-like uncharacterized protein
MSAEENKDIVRRCFAALDEHRIDVVEDLLAPQYRLHFDANPEMNREAAIGFFTAFVGAFPDIRHEIKDQFAEGESVATRLVVSGTHQAELMGIPATGHTIAIGAINIIHCDDGKLVEHWVSSDGLTMMQQLGVIPSPEPPSA